MKHDKGEERRNKKPQKLYKRKEEGSGECKRKKRKITVVCRRWVPFMVKRTGGGAGSGIGEEKSREGRREKSFTAEPSSSSLTLTSESKVLIATE